MYLLIDSELLASLDSLGPESRRQPLYLMIADKFDEGATSPGVLRVLGPDDQPSVKQGHESGHEEDLPPLRLGEDGLHLAEGS